MAKGKRAAAALAAAAILLALLCSTLFIAFNAGHDCVGGDCGVCCRILFCQTVLKGLSLAARIAILAAALSYALRAVVCAREQSFRRCTPVSLKVKLTN